MNRVPLSLRVVLAFGLGGIVFSAGLPAAEVLIQTNFSEADAEGRPFAQPMDPPLSGPSEVRSGSDASRLRVGTEPLKGLQPPYALFEEKTKPGSQSIETLSLFWDLQEMGYLSGIYELSYRFMIVSESLQSGARMRIELCGEGGAPLKPDPPVHISSYPAQVYISRDRFTPSSDGREVTVLPGEVRAVRIVLDLDKQEWSSYVDGAELVSPTPISEALRNAGPLQIKGVRFGSTSSPGSESSYVLANVTLRRLEPRP